MRMRSRGHLEQRLAACSDITINCGEGFSLPSPPVHIEIGCGKGSFITQTAALHPEVNYIAVEKISNVIVLAMEKAKAAELTNLQFIRGDFADVAPLIPDSSIERIYLNFSDPWPKTGYAKRRLTHGNFLSLYRRILSDTGEIHFKTDNRSLFDFSLETFPQNDFELRNVTFDLHNSGFEGNIMTEYERRFSDMGTPICRLEAIKR
ncbi:MAG: tRNA (guanosine(46)-N7)-methyltransferase TrmB [Clostridia bacterium]